MKLRTLELRGAPGLPGTLRLDPIDPGLTLVLGPNASGKSSLARALRSLFYSGPVSAVESGLVEAQLSYAGTLYPLRRSSGGPWRWPEGPPRPADLDMGLYRFDLGLMLAPEFQQSDLAFAQRLAQELAGGYNLVKALSDHQLPARARSHSGSVVKTLAAANRVYRAALQAARGLLHEEERLDELESRLAKLRQTRGALPAAEGLLNLHDKLLQRQAALEALQGFDPRCAQLKDDTLERLAELEALAAQTQDKVQASEDEVQQAKLSCGRLQFQGLEASARARCELELEAWEDRAGSLRQLAHKREQQAESSAAATAAVAQARQAIFLPASKPTSADPADHDTLAVQDEDWSHFDELLTTLQAERASQSSLQAEHVRQQRELDALPVGAMAAPGAEADSAVDAGAASTPIGPAGREESQGEHQDDEALRRAQDALLGWLALADPVGPSGAATQARSEAGQAQAGLGRGTLLGLCLVAGLAFALALWAALAGPPGPSRLLVLFGALTAGAAGARALKLWRAGAAKPLNASQAARDAERAARVRDAETVPSACPAQWTRPQVRQALESVLRQRQQLQRADQLCRNLRELNTQIEACEARLQEAAQALRTWCEERRLQPEFASLVVRERGARLVKLVAALDEQARLRGQQAALQDQLNAELQALRAFMQALGLEPAMVPGELDAASAHKLVSNLKERFAALGRAEQSCEQAGTRLTAASAALKQARVNLQRFFESIGFQQSERPVLERLHQQLVDYRLCKQAADNASAASRALAQNLNATQLASLVRVVGQSAPPLPEGVDPEWLLHPARALEPCPAEASEPLRGWLVALLPELQQADHEEAELRDQCSRLKERVQAASEGNHLELARFERDQAEQALRQQREEYLRRELSCALLGRAKRAHYREQAPEALKKAQDYFGRFTQHHFELEFEPNADEQGQRFLARDTTTGALLPLGKLSEGTRVHLLLAARLGYLHSAEGSGPRLPLCLDETFATTDPVRFREIAAALLELTEERQLLYFSSRPLEVALWQQLAKELGRPPIALLQMPGARQGAVWQEAATATFGSDAGGPSLPAALPLPPAPTSDAAADADAQRRWRESLKLQLPSGHAPASRWPLPCLLPPDLHALYLLMQTGLQTVGHFRSWSERYLGADKAGVSGGLKVGEITPAFVKGLALRAALLEQLLEAWREGRSAPVSSALLREKGVPQRAISSAKLEELEPLLEGCDGDAQKILEVYSGLPGVGRTTTQKLRGFLEDEGLLAEGSSLAPEIIRARVMGQLERHLGAAEAGLLPRREARTLCDALLKQLFGTHEATEPDPGVSELTPTSPTSPAGASPDQTQLL